MRRILASEGTKVPIAETKQALVETHDGEWHHTSKFGNRTHYYDPALALAKLRLEKR